MAENTNVDDNKTQNEFVSVDDLNSFHSSRDIVLESEYSRGGLSSVWGSYSDYKAGHLKTTMPDEMSFDVDVENVENACAQLTKLSNELSESYDTLLKGYPKVLDSFCTKFEGGCDGQLPKFSKTIISIENLRDDLDSLKEKLMQYAYNGDATVFGENGSWLSDRFGINPFAANIDGDWGSYGDSGGNSDTVTNPNRDDSDAGDVDTDIDTDVDNKPSTDPSPSTKPSISTSITGAGIGSTLLGMATGAAGVAGAGALIDGDSVLDELDDTVIVPSTIRNSSATSIRKSKKDKVGAAVGVGLAAAAAGAGLYYYSKKAEEEEDDKNAEKVVLQDDNEDGAVEFQYTSGLGNVVELKDAILNDTLK